MPPTAANLPSAEADPYKYRVQTWDAPDPAATADPGLAPVEEERIVAPPRPAFVPYGGYVSSTTAPQMGSTVYGTTSNMPAAPAASPAAGQARADGTYAPYSADTARKLEAQKSERSWLVPSLGAAALLLIVLLAVGGYLLLTGNNNTANNTPTAASGDTTAPTGSSDQEVIKSVIQKSNSEQITAWHNLDTSVLSGTRTGQVLQDNIQAVNDLRSKNMYAIPVNKSLQFGEIVVNGDTATAKTVEVWTVTFYSKDNNSVVLQTGPDTLRETYHLVKQNGAWLVSTLDIIQDQPPGTPGAPGNNT